jgi:hypothetical protein
MLQNCPLIKEKIVAEDGTAIKKEETMEYLYRICESRESNENRTCNRHG